MTPNEFKAWFDGFTEAFDKTPSQKQWARIKERVAEIDGKPVTEKVYIDRYLPYIRPWVTGPYYTPYHPGYYYSTVGGTSGGIGAGSNVNQASQSYRNALGASLQGQSVTGQYAGANECYNSTNAMNALGRAEAQAVQ